MAESLLDAPAPPAVPAAVAPAPAPAPVAAATPEPAPAPAPPAPAEAAPAQAITPSPAPPAPTPAAAPAATPAAEPELTGLQKFDKDKADKEKAATEAAKPAAAPPSAAETKPADAANATPASSPEPAPVEYKYNLPETMQMTDALKGDVHAAFDAFRTNPAEGAQALVDLHEKQMKAYAEFLYNEQRRIFTETRQGWWKQAQNEGMNEAAMGAVARMRDLFVPESEKAEFEKFLQVTGAGDHPQFLKMLHQAARWFDEPAMPAVTARPPPGNGQRPARRLRDIYDNPRSQGRP